jgi:hypothetical protein
VVEVETAALEVLVVVEETVALVELETPHPPLRHKDTTVDNAVETLVEVVELAALVVLWVEVVVSHLLQAHL